MGISQMTDPDDREKHSRRRKRNIMAKVLRDPGEHRGAFALKVIDSRKTKYKREKINVRQIEEENE